MRTHETQQTIAVERLGAAAWLHANGVKALARRVEGEHVKWLFPYDQRVAALLEAWTDRDEMRRTLRMFADAYAKEAGKMTLLLRPDRCYTCSRPIYRRGTR